MKFLYNHQNNTSFKITCKYEPIQVEMNVKLETETHIGCMLPKLNSACFVIRCFEASWHNRKHLR
jgi:hypothetical protein